ncbi:hypothetical protein GMOD_00009952 [Pyrenophora seminiperda CCB06]|uniref:Uncharacterized protein n=1 Tax=Pyrenophora seminiperda CCB06 TaxID=1302712 RepID=A0A3M7M1M3_9PLEO|nr:hypothetical protein GMOD_00009952 [Pyrenophora seminiperda CCB06]
MYSTVTVVSSQRKTLPNQANVSLAITPCSKPDWQSKMHSTWTWSGHSTVLTSTPAATRVDLRYRKSFPPSCWRKVWIRIVITCCGNPSITHIFQQLGRTDVESRILLVGRTILVETYQR